MQPSAIVVNFEPWLLASMLAHGRLLQRTFVQEYSLENMMQVWSLEILRSDDPPLIVDWQATLLLSARQSTASPKRRNWRNGWSVCPKCMNRF